MVNNRTNSRVSKTRPYSARGASVSEYLRVIWRRWVLLNFTHELGTDDAKVYVRHLVDVESGTTRWMLRKLSGLKGR